MVNSFAEQSQFHYGSIQIYCLLKQIKRQDCLNSTMVRFKSYYSGKFEIEELESQFHYGSIQIMKKNNSLINLDKSQFHYGSIQMFIEIIINSSLSLSQFHYGSIQIGKVNLPATDDVASQFHYGSIQMKMRCGM